MQVYSGTADWKQSQDTSVTDTKERAAFKSTCNEFTHNEQTSKRTQTSDMNCKLKYLNCITLLYKQFSTTSCMRQVSFKNVIKNYC